MNGEIIKSAKISILVTGAAGFIGANLISKLLLSDSSLFILGIDSMNEYYDVSLKEYRLNRLLPNTRFHFIKGNIADKKFLDDIFDRYKFDIVVNLAAQAGVRYSIINPASYIESNIIGFFNILECSKNKAVKHLVYASSSSVYGGNTKIPFSENDNVDHPVSLYAATKKSNELMAYSYSKLYNLPCTGLRFFTVYGPAGRPDMAYFSFTRKLINRENIKVFNFGNCYRDFTYIDDITEGIYRIIFNPPNSNLQVDGSALPPYKVFNIGNSNPVKLSDFIDVLAIELINVGLLPENFNVSYYQELIPMQPGDVPVTYADTSTIENEFGFKPKTSLQFGLNSFAKWYKEFYFPKNK